MLRFFFFFVILGSTQVSYACEILGKLLPLYHSPTVTLDFHRADATVDRFVCEGGDLIISTTTNSMRIDRFKTGKCDETGLSLRFYTARIYFEGNEIAYYDKAGVRHLAPVSCSSDEISFDIPERETSQTDPWPHGRSQLSLSIQNSKLIFNWKRFLEPGSYTQASAEF